MGSSGRDCFAQHVSMTLNSNMLQLLCCVSFMKNSTVSMPNYTGLCNSELFIYIKILIYILQNCNMLDMNFTKITRGN